MANPKTKLYPSLKIYADMVHFQFLWAYKKAPMVNPQTKFGPIAWKSMEKWGLPVFMSLSFFVCLVCLSRNSQNKFIDNLIFNLPFYT